MGEDPFFMRCGKVHINLFDINSHDGRDMITGSKRFKFNEFSVAFFLFKDVPAAFKR